MFITYCVLLSLPLQVVTPVDFPSAGKDQYLSIVEQQRIHKLWPKGLAFPDRLHFYNRSNYSQRLTITNGLDHHVWVPTTQNDSTAREINPNRKFPWATSGGTDDLADFVSYVGVSFPKDAKVNLYIEHVDAGARRALPMHKWSWPKGSIFIDMLTHKKQTFEVRKREKVSEDEWTSKVVFTDVDCAPSGFTGAGQSCMSCHGKTGSQDGYGIRIRGGDTVFSLTPISLIPKK